MAKTLPPQPIFFLFVFFILVPFWATAQGPPPPAFKCTTKTTCNALVGYKSPNTTTISHIQSLFQVKNLKSLLGVNNLPPTTPPNHIIKGNSTVRIPFPCQCINGIGLSNHVPTYTVVKDDGLYHIAYDVFGGLLDYPSIVSANKIKDPNRIDIGQKLWIPLPCSCDDVDGQEVVHYGHVVASGSSVAKIAAEFGTNSNTLMMLNNITDPKSLVAGQVLDVPIKACSSNVSSSSPDAPLLVANGTTTYTANDCVMCKCDPTNNFTLQCKPSGLKAVNWPSCPAMQCAGSSLSLGNSTILSSCKRSTCAYAGYDKQDVLTNLATIDTCAGPGSSSNEAPKIHQISWSLGGILLCLQLIMLHRFF
ncbi:unnamed protein product [Amaranthus hypochondriacus]